MITNGMSEAFVGGPRISDEAWALLWARLFEAEAMESDLRNAMLMDEEADDLAEYGGDDHPPPVPPIPRNHLHRDARIEEDTAPMSNTLSDDSSSREGNESNYSYQPEPQSAASFSQGNAHFQREQRRGMRASPPTASLPPLSRPQSAASRRYDQRSLSQYSTHSIPNLRSYSQSGSRPSRSSMFVNDSAFSARAHSSHSSRNSRYGSRLPPTPPEPAFASSVIVGKIEFDIDRRRGGSRWFDAWIEQAQTSPTTPSSARKARTMPTDDSTIKGGVSSAPTHQQSPSMSGHQELFLPGLVNRRQQGISETSTESFSVESASEEANPSQGSLRKHGDTHERTISALSAATPMPLTRQLSQAKDLPQRRSSSPTSPARLSARSASPASEIASDEQSISEGEAGYSLLANQEDDEETTEGHNAADQSDEEPTSGKSTAQIPQSQSFGSNLSGKDPLGDVFGSDEAAWVATRPHSLAETGLGIVGAEHAPEFVHEEELVADEDDVAEVKQLLEQKNLGGEQQPAPQLSSPIHLGSPTMEVIEPELDTGFLAALKTPPSPSASTTYNEDVSASGPMIIRQSPTVSASSRAPSMANSSSNYSISSLANASSPSNDIDHAQAYQLSEEPIPEAEEEPDYSQVKKSFQDEERPSGVSKRPHENVHPGIRQNEHLSRRSSTDSNSDLDDLERALAELSPRALKHSPMSPGYHSNRSSPYGTPTTGVRPLRNFFDRKGSVRALATDPQGSALVADIPGYQSPAQLKSPVGITHSEQSSSVDQELEQPRLRSFAEPEVQQTPELTTSASLASLPLSPPRSSSLQSAPPLSLSLAMEAPLPVSPAATDSASAFSPVENIGLPYLNTGTSPTSSPIEQSISYVKEEKTASKSLGFGSLRITKPWSDRSHSKSPAAAPQVPQLPQALLTSSSSSIKAEEEPKSPYRFKFWRKDSSDPLGTNNRKSSTISIVCASELFVTALPHTQNEQIPAARQSSEASSSPISPLNTYTFPRPPPSPSSVLSASQSFSQQSDIYLSANPIGTSSTSDQFLQHPEDRDVPSPTPSNKSNRRHGMSSAPTSPIFSETPEQNSSALSDQETDKDYNKTQAERFYDSDRSSLFSQDGSDKGKGKQQSLT